MFTKARSRKVRTCARTVRAVPIQESSPTTTPIIQTAPTGKYSMTNISRKNIGITNSTSETMRITVSIAPLTYPAKNPITVPMTVPKMPANNPIINVCGVPIMSSAIIDLPNASVPNQCSQLGR